MPEKKDTLVLIDGHALAYRMYYALPAESFSIDTGELTNATYGFTRMLLDVLLDEQPKYLAVMFDAGMSGRDEVYAGYKATREKSPEDLKPQVIRIRQILEAFNVPVIMLDGWEADDLIGTAARQAEAMDVNVHVVTGDKDLLQLVTELTRVQLPGRRQGDVKLYDVERFRSEYSLEPVQLVDLKGFIGDKSDNIPGVYGIGEKGATKLLTQYGTLESVYEHLDEIKGATHKKLEAGRDDAFLSKALATIKRDAPIELNLASCVAADYDPTPVLDLFRELQFRSLSDRLHRASAPPAETVPATAPAAGRQLSMFGDADIDATAKTSAVASVPAGAPAESPTGTATHIVDDADALAALTEQLGKAEAITVDVETTGTDQMAVDLVGIAITGAAGEGSYIPVGHNTDEPQLPLEQVREALRPALTDPGIPKYGHNIKYDYVVLRRHGFDVTPIAYDTMIAAWVVNPGGFLGLKDLAWSRLEKRMTHIEDLIGKGKSQITMAQVQVKAAAPYAAADVDMTHQLVGDLTPELKGYGEQMWKLFEEIEMPLVPVLADMEMHGVLLDRAFLAKMSDELAVELDALEGNIHEMVGYTFNVNSTQQLSKALFEDMGLPTEGLRRTSSGHISTAAGVLEMVLDRDGERPAIIDVILQYRELAKLKSTYVDALPQLVNPETGRVHTSFNQTGTVTGRISSSDPNLQNIPIRTPVGARVREAFVAPPSKLLLACDYSQVELRVLAHVCQDPGLLRAFREGQDIHAATAAVVFDIPIDRVTKGQRSFAKRVNFGLLYGMTAFRLARETDLTLGESERFVKAYFDGFPNVQNYLEETKQKAADLGYVETLFGRRRYFPVLKTTDDRSVSKMARQRAEREAINMPIQGTAADIIKIAMIRLHKALRERGMGGRMLLQVHDELVLEVPKDELEATTALVREVMEGAFEMDAPLVVDANAGPNWNALAPV